MKQTVRGMQIHVMACGHPLWDQTIAFAEKCAWKAGPYLANILRKNEFLAWERVVAAVRDSRVIGFCTFTGKDELPEEHGYSPFIGFVFVEEGSRGQRISEKMISRASEYAKTLGYKAVYLMSGEKGLYEKYGFVKIGDFETIWGTVDQLFQKELLPDRSPASMQS